MQNDITLSVTNSSFDLLTRLRKTLNFTFDLQTQS